MWTLESVGLLLEWLSLPLGAAGGEEQTAATGRRTQAGGSAERCCKVRVWWLSLLSETRH